MESHRNMWNGEKEHRTQHWSIAPPAQHSQPQRRAREKRKNRRRKKKSRRETETETPTADDQSWVGFGIGNTWIERLYNRCFFSLILPFIGLFSVCWVLEKKKPRKRTTKFLKKTKYKLKSRTEDGFWWRRVWLLLEKFPLSRVWMRAVSRVQVHGWWWPARGS